MLARGPDTGMLCPELLASLHSLHLCSSASLKMVQNSNMRRLSHAYTDKYVNACVCVSARAHTHTHVYFS